MENSVRSRVIWDEVLESLWVLMLPGEEKIIAYVSLKFVGGLQEHCWYLENTILK